MEGPNRGREGGGKGPVVRVTTGKEREKGRAKTANEIEKTKPNMPCVYCCSRLSTICSAQTRAASKACLRSWLDFTASR